MRRILTPSTLITVLGLLFWYFGLLRLAMLFLLAVGFGGTAIAWYRFFKRKEKGRDILFYTLFHAPQAFLGIYLSTLL